MANLATNSETEANLYVFLTVSQSQYFSGLAPKIGSVCDSRKDRRVSITKYLNGDADTAMVMQNLLLTLFWLEPLNKYKAILNIYKQSIGFVSKGIFAYFSGSSSWDCT